MKCPSCQGRGVVTGFIDGVKNGKRFGRLSPELPCYTCNSTGEVSDEMPRWQERGAAIKRARLERRESMMGAADRLGVGLVLYSRMERGLMDPSPIEEGR